MIARNIDINRLRKALGLSVLAAVGMVALDLAPAFAKPPAHAPAHGYRRNQEGKQDKHYEKQRERYDDDRYEDDDDDRYRSERRRYESDRQRRYEREGERRRDLDRDGIPDHRDTDIDGDGIENSRDSNPYEYNTRNRTRRTGDSRRTQRDRYTRAQDLDGDGQPNWSDRDMDGDGVKNNSDRYPRDSGRH